MRPFLLANPATIEQLVRKGYFPSRRAAQTRMLHLYRKGRVKRVGSVPAEPGTGRNCYVYSLRYWKQDHLIHEVNVTEFLIHFPGEYVRGHDVDKAKRPDFELIVNGHRYYGEVDCCTETLNQVGRRLAVYDPEDIVLFVIFGETEEESEDRKAKIMRRVKDSGRMILFTTIQKVHADPHGAIFETAQGTGVAMERPGETP